MLLYYAPHFEPTDTKSWMYLFLEHLAKEILKEFLARYGKVPDKEKEKNRLGMSQKEYAIGVVNDYDLPITPDQYIEAVMPLFQDK